METELATGGGGWLAAGESNVPDGFGERGIFCKGTDWTPTGVDMG